MSTSRINARAQLTTTSFAVALGGLVAGLTCTSQLAAQTSDAIAESLYQDAKSNFQAGDYEHACPKLAQSYKVDPAGGTVLLLAICYEKQGKLASAWARYNEALAIAKRDGRDDRERRAQDGLESVKPKLSYIKLTFDPVTQGIPGIVLMIDGTELPAISDTPLAVDTGTHHLAIRAPQYETWQVDVAVADQGQTQDVSVPQLQPVVEHAPPVEPPQPAVTTTAPEAPPPVPIQKDQVPAVSHARARRTAWVIGGAGVVALGVGSYFGVRAIRLNKDANAVCPTTECPSSQADAVTTNQSALKYAHAADVALGVGTAAVLSAAVLLYIYRHDEPPITASADPLSRSLSVSFRRSF